MAVSCEPQDPRGWRVTGTHKTLASVVPESKGKPSFTNAD